MDTSPITVQYCASWLGEKTKVESQEDRLRGSHPAGVRHSRIDEPRKV